MLNYGHTCSDVLAMQTVTCAQALQGASLYSGHMLHILPPLSWANHSAYHPACITGPCKIPL